MANCLISIYCLGCEEECIAGIAIVLCAGVGGGVIILTVVVLLIRYKKKSKGMNMLYYVYAYH